MDFSLLFIVFLNLGYHLLELGLGWPEPLAVLVTFAVSFFFLVIPHLDNVGILVTDQRVFVISNLYKHKHEIILLAEISDPILSSGVLSFNIAGKKRQFAMNGFSSMYWNEKKRKDFLRQFTLAVNQSQERGK